LIIQLTAVTHTEGIKKMTSAIIIGGGPAGCQCALWLKMLGHDAIIIEQSARLGAQTHSSESYLNNWLVGTIGLNGQKIAENIHEHIMQMNIPVFFNTHVSKIKMIERGFEVMVKNNQLEAPYLVVATGAKPRQGNFFSSKNVLIGPGSITSSYLFEGKKVAILGGGDNAAGVTVKCGVWH
jgi:thioredoxin reductase